jgi:small subunit ribosomal protein S17
MQGVVISNKMQKTIVVKVDRHVKHALYKKYVLKSNKYKAHDEKNEANVGDKVVIVETRPISRRKSFTLGSIIEKAEVKHVEAAVEVPGVSDKAEKAGDK